MKLKIVRDGKVEVVTDADLLLVTDDNDTPVAVASIMGPTFLLASIEDLPRFNAALRQLGLDRTVLVEDGSHYLKADAALSSA